MCGAEKAIKIPNSRGITFTAFQALCSECSDKVDSGDENARFRDRWITDFWISVRTLRDVAVDRFVVAVFWLKLHGILVELHDRWTDLVAPFGALSPGGLAALHARGPGASTALQVIGHMMALRDVTRRLANRYTREEHIYADWRRQAEAHPTQEAYGLRLQKKGSGLRDRCRIKSIREEVTITDLAAAIDAVERAHKHREAAVDFARKIVREAREIYLVQNQLAPLMGIRDWREPEM